MQIRAGKRVKRSGSPLVRCAVFLLVFASELPAAAGEGIAVPVAEAAFPAALSHLDREWNCTFRAGDKLRVMAAAELAYWGRLREVAARPQVLLPQGGAISADVLKLDDEYVHLGDATGLALGLWADSKLPRSSVAAILLQPPASRRERDRMIRDLITAGAESDRLFLSGGETLDGKLLSIPRMASPSPPDGAPGETFQFLRRGDAEALPVPASKVVAVGLAKATSAATTTNSMAIWLGLDDGSLLLVASLRVTNAGAVLKLIGGGELAARQSGAENSATGFWNSITYLEPAGPRVAWLSDLSPVGYKHIPFLSGELPYGVDESALGLRLRAGRDIFRKGLGVPTASRLAYDCAGFRRFEAEIALDAEAGLRGSVKFKVMREASGDWQLAYESPVLRGGDPPLPISVELRGATRLALLVEFADRGDECDWANWLQARLVK